MSNPHKKAYENLVGEFQSVYKHWVEAMEENRILRTSVMLLKDELKERHGEDFIEQDHKVIAKLDDYKYEKQ